jgi:hypothetical protein
MASMVGAVHGLRASYVYGGGRETLDLSRAKISDGGSTWRGAYFCQG